jgi:uncharacterized protein YkwD
MLPTLAVAALLINAACAYTTYVIPGEDSLLVNQVYALSNFARASPSNYKSIFGCKRINCAHQPLNVLTFNRQLKDAAERWSSYMSSANCFEHYRCGCRGSDDQCQRLKSRLGWYGNYWTGENLVKMSRHNAITTVNMWLESEGHCENMYKPQFKEVGIEYVGQYGTQEFGGCDSRPSPANTILVGVHVDDSRFVAIVDRQTDGTDVHLVYGGQRYPMKSMGNGVYYYQMNNGYGSPQCTKYYFEVVQGSTTVSKFPVEEGTMMQQNCPSDFVKSQTSYAAPAVAPASVARTSYAAPAANEDYAGVANKQAGGYKSAVKDVAGNAEYEEYEEEYDCDEDKKSTYGTTSYGTTSADDSAPAKKEFPMMFWASIIIGPTVVCGLLVLVAVVGRRNVKEGRRWYQN